MTGTPLSAILLVSMLPIAPVAAATVNDPTGDFLATYVGPQVGGLDVQVFSVSNQGSNFFLDTLVAGPVSGIGTGFYVYGVNRGAGVAGFAANGIDNVFFDAVVILRPDSSGAVIINGVTTALAGGAVTVSGNRITGLVPYSFLPANGFASTDQYGFNLWPRLPGGGFPNISDFAPNNASITAVPEPAAWAMMIGGFALAGGAMRARRRPLAA